MLNYDRKPPNNMGVGSQIKLPKFCKGLLLNTMNLHIKLTNS